MRFNFLFITTIVFISLLIISQTCSAQNGKVSGRVLNEKYQLLDGTSITLRNPDSSIAVIAATDSVGEFTLQAKAGKFLLSVTMLDYKLFEQPVEIIAHQTISLQIVLQHSIRELQATIITAKRKPIIFEAGKTIVSPGASLVMSQGNLFEAMKNIPGLVLMEDGTILLNGQKNVNFLINGRQTYLSGAVLVSFLRTIAAQGVDKIEIMTSPSAEYDAAGTAGVINIHLKKSAAQGFVTTPYFNYQQGKNAKFDMGVGLGIRGLKTGMKIDYSYFEGKKAKRGLMSRSFITENNIELKNLQDVFLINRDRNHKIKLAADWDIYKNISVDAYAGLMLANRQTPGSAETSFFSGATNADSILYTNTLSTPVQKSYNAGIRGVYKDAGKNELVLSLDYLFFKHDEGLNLRSRLTKSANLSRNDTLFGNLNDRVNILSVQGAYTRKISGAWQLQTGIKTVNISTDNSALYRRSVNAGLMPDEQRSNEYLYKEINNALYVQMNGKWRQWHMVAGLRAENTALTGTQYNIASRKPDSAYQVNYSKLFPNFSLLYHLDDKQDISFTYNRRITRPNYRDLSPSGYMVDEYLVMMGNAALRAELTQQTEFTYVLQKNFRATFFYHFTNDAISKAFHQRENSSLVVMPENLGTRRSAGLRMDAGKIIDINWWKLSANLSVYYSESKWKENKMMMKKTMLTPAFSINNNFKMGYGWGAQLTGYYNGKVNFGQMQVPALWSVSAAVQKKIWAEKISINLYVNDVFSSIHENIIFKTQSLQGHTKVRYDETSVGISVQYQFKKGRQKTFSERNIEEKGRINF